MSLCLAFSGMEGAPGSPLVVVERDEVHQEHAEKGNEQAPNLDQAEADGNPSEKAISDLDKNSKEAFMQFNIAPKQKLSSGGALLEDSTEPSSKTVDPQQLEEDAEGSDMPPAVPSNRRLSIEEVEKRYQSLGISRFVLKNDSILQIINLPSNLSSHLGTAEFVLTLT